LNIRVLCITLLNMINIIRKLNRNHISRKNGELTLYYAYKAKEIELFNNS